jgi:hypothetical protein
MLDATGQKLSILNLEVFWSNFDYWCGLIQQKGIIDLL